MTLDRKMHGLGDRDACRLLTILVARTVVFAELPLVISADLQVADRAYPLSFTVWRALYGRLTASGAGVWHACFSLS